MEAKFVSRLRRLKYDARQRRALAAVTLGSASRFLCQGCSLDEFFEEVEYNGRRLAKLNLPPTAVAKALREYDRLLRPALAKLLSPGPDRYGWVREQAQFFVMLTLNNAYYQVREEETQAFYEMFWAELKATTLDEVLNGFLEILARFCRSDCALLYLLDEHAGFNLRARYGAPVEVPRRKNPSPPLEPAVLDEPRSFELDADAAPYVLNAHWKSKFVTCWSVPLKKAGALVGVLQFAFKRPYHWLPREHDLLAAAAERCALAIEKAQLMEHLATQEKQIRALAETMMTVEEAERRRVSRELHDQTGQDLLWIRLQMEMLENELPDTGNRWRSRAGEIRDMTERTIVEIRRLIAALSPAVLEQLGLAPALRQLVTRFRSAYPAKVKLHVGRLGHLTKKTEVLVYRLVQECLNNVAKHSSCATVSISVGATDEWLSLEVHDDGVGFCPDEALKKTGSFGLSGIRERVALMGGQCNVRSRRADPSRQGRQNTGTQVRIDLPLKTGTGADELLRQPERYLADQPDRPKQREFVNR